jgi:predicted aspartyl protease
MPGARKFSLFLIAVPAALCLLAAAAPAHTAPRAPAAGKAPAAVPSMPALPPAVIDDTLAIGGQDIEARMRRTRMTVEVGVNGTGPYRFIVDSGADSSVVGERIARQLQLLAGTPAMLNAMTASSRVDRVRVDELLLGETTFHDLELPVLQEQHLGGAGMVGIDALVEQRLMLDFEARTIKVEDAKQPAQSLDGEIVVTARRRRGQLILTEVKAAGLPLDAVVDTGSEITIGNVALRDRLMRRHRDKFVTVAITGVTGVTIEVQLARIGELKLGSVTLRDVPMAFADVPPFAVFGLSQEPALLLGTDVLEVFRRVSLDFRSRKVRFQLKRCGTVGIMLSTSFSSSLTRLSSDGNAAVCRR